MANILNFKKGLKQKMHFLKNNSYFFFIWYQIVYKSINKSIVWPCNSRSDPIPWLLYDPVRSRLTIYIPNYGSWDYYLPVIYLPVHTYLSTCHVTFQTPTSDHTHLGHTRHCHRLGCGLYLSRRGVTVGVGSTGRRTVFLLLSLEC